MLVWLEPTGTGWKGAVYEQGRLTDSWHQEADIAAAQEEAERRVGRHLGWRRENGGHVGYSATICHPEELAPGDVLRHPAAPSKRLAVRDPGVVRYDRRRLWLAVEPFWIEGRWVKWVLLFDDDRAEILPE